MVAYQSRFPVVPGWIILILQRIGAEQRREILLGPETKTSAVDRSMVTVPEHPPHGKLNPTKYTGLTGQKRTTYRSSL